MPPRRTPRTTTRRTRQPPRSHARAGLAFDRLINIMAVLRSPRGCPWDLKQTHTTLRPFLIEETYEAIDAIDRNDFDALCGELGDVLLQCVFHAQLAAESDRFTIRDVVETLAAKLIRRHPHVFARSGRPLPANHAARGATRTPSAVKEQWARLKVLERTEAGESPRVLAGVPRALPALLRAEKISTRVAAVGFEWPQAVDVLDKVEEELRELREALSESPARAAEEMGDLLFSVANLARKLAIEPEGALAAANDKFTRRFDLVETYLEDQGRSVHDASLAEMEAAWQLVKNAPAAGLAKARPTDEVEVTPPRPTKRARSRSTDARPDRRSRH